MKKINKYFVLFLVATLCITGCGVKKNNDGNPLNPEDVINYEVPNNVTHETFYSFDNSELIVHLTNNGDTALKSVEVDVKYYDDDDEVGNDFAVVNVLPAKGDTYISLILPYDDDFNSYVPDKVDVKIVDQGTTYEYTDNAELLENINSEAEILDDGEGVNVTIANDTGSKLESIYADVVFFNGDVPVSIGKAVVSDIEANQTSTEFVENPSAPSDDGVREADYDKVRVIITDAF